VPGTARAGPRQGLAPGRRLAFPVLAAMLILAAVEVLAWATLSAIDGSPARWSRLAARRAALTGFGELTDDAGDDQPTSGGAEEVPSWSTDLSILHPYLGFVEPPDPLWRRAATRLDPNAAGFGFPRNFHPFFPSSPVDRVVVVVVGGSVAQQVAGHGRPVPYLEQALAGLERFDGRQVAVLNLAMGGYKQPQQLMALSYFLAIGLPMDAVINLDGLNEVTLPVHENLSSGVFPFYPRAWNFRVGDIDQEERRARGAVVLLRDSRRSLARASGRRPWRYSFTAGLIWRLVDGHLERWTAQRQRDLVARRPVERNPQSFGPPTSFSSGDELRRELVAVWRRSSLQMDRLARGFAVEYYHFLQPNQYDPGSKRLTAGERSGAFDTSSPFRGLVAQGYPLLRSAGVELQREGVHFVDLSREFSAVDETLYIDTCCHLNRAGIRRLVERIAATVAAGPLGADAR
jgi:hypothetical protein